MKHARSAGRTPAFGTGSSDDDARNWSQSWVGTTSITSSGGPTTIAAPNSGTSRPAMGATRPAKSPWATITFEPESASWWRRKSPLYAVFTGTWTAPSFSAAKKLTTWAGPFSRSVATRSLLPTPSPASARASRLLSASMRRAVYSSPSKSRYGPSGSASRRRMSASSTVVCGRSPTDLTLPSGSDAVVTGRFGRLGPALGSEPQCRQQRVAELAGFDHLVVAHRVG